MKNPRRHAPSRRLSFSCSLLLISASIMPWFLVVALPLNRLLQTDGVVRIPYRCPEHSFMERTDGFVSCYQRDRSNGGFSDENGAFCPKMRTAIDFDGLPIIMIGHVLARSCLQRGQIQAELCCGAVAGPCARSGHRSDRCHRSRWRKDGAARDHYARPAAHP